MNFLAKIENVINLLLVKLGELMLRFVPKPIKTFFHKIHLGISWFITKLKSIPVKLKTSFPKLMVYLKEMIGTIDFKAIFVDSYKKAMEQYKETSPASKWKTLFMAPFLVVGQWLQGLTAAQSLLLMTFSAASFLAVIGISFSGNRIIDQHFSNTRTPASVEEEVQYERPKYYKKQARHFDLTNLRLPIYFPKINEVRSVDIDFTATLSNRRARMFLEKHEFHLRDHLILQIEPSIASFPLEEEGKEIIRQKLHKELNEFLMMNNVEGEVKELKITYILAN